MTPEQIEAHYRAWWAAAHPGAAPPSLHAVGNAMAWAQQLLEERRKVFAVFEDDYDDRRLRAVFSSPDAAATFQRFVDVQLVPEEHVIDSESPPDWWDSGMSYFRCWRRNNTPHGLSAQVECYICSPGSWPAPKKDVDWNDDGVFQVMAGIGTRVVARTEKDAIQIAQDRFNRFLESTDIFQR